jgi:hypothetical protein
LLMQNSSQNPFQGEVDCLTLSLHELLIAAKNQVFSPSALFMQIWKM